MREFTVFVGELTDRTRPEAPPSYKIALSPSNRGGGAMATKRYLVKEHFVHDLQQRLRYADGAIEQFFASEDKHQTLVNYPLIDEDAVYLGWLADFDRN
jgi:hypothetical protein